MNFPSLKYLDREAGIEAVISPTYVCTISKQILDAGKGEPAAPSSSSSLSSSAAEPGRSNALIGLVTLGESDLRFLETGPPCKVLELPLELPNVPPAAVAGRGRRRQAPHAPQGLHRPAIVLFLERPPPRGFLEIPLPLPRALSSPTATTAAPVTTIAAAHGGGTAPAPAPAAAPIAAALSPIGSGNESEGQTVQTTPRMISRETVVVDEIGEPPPPPAATTSLASGKMRLKVLQAWGLAVGAKYFDVVVAVRACGRDVGTTRVSAVGGTTSPEWIDEQ